MLEQWTHWKPIEGLSKKYYTDSLSRDNNKFEMVLSDSEDEYKKIRIFFDGGVQSYRSTNESFRLAIVDDLHERYGVQFYGHWTFFKVTNSSYLKWLSEQSDGISDIYNFTHFALLTADSLEDIISGKEPLVEFIKM